MQQQASRTITNTPRRTPNVLVSLDCAANQEGKGCWARGATDYFASRRGLTLHAIDFAALYLIGEAMHMFTKPFNRQRPAACVRGSFPSAWDDTCDVGPTNSNKAPPYGRGARGQAGLCANHECHRGRSGLHTPSGHGLGHRGTMSSAMPLRPIFVNHNPRDR